MGSIPTPATKQGNTVENKELVEQLENTFNSRMKAIEQDQEAFWNSLSKADQIKCFCAVSRRIYRGELEDRGTYRWVLYDVFQFGPEAYCQAQDAGYLAIHNSIFTAEEERKLLLAFAKKLGVQDPEASVTDFYRENI